MKADANDMDVLVVGQLLGLVAHDLRNPLSALHSNVSFLSSTLQQVDEDVAEALSDGLVSCDGLRHIIDNLDLLGQHLRGGSQPPRSSLSIGALIDDAVGRSQRAAASYVVELQVHVQAADRLLQVIGARELLARALGNLIHNCIQYSAADSVVALSVSRVEDEVRILVADQSLPFEASETEQLFSAAGQILSKASLGGSRYGRGLGLLAARLAADASGARVAIERSVPQNFINAFVLTVPAFDSDTAYGEAELFRREK